MNLSALNPFNWRRGEKLAGDPRVTTRDTQSQGPYTEHFKTFVARSVDPILYEVVREAVAPVDGAINKLVELDGIVRFEAESTRLENALQEFVEGVPVNDHKNGLQAYYQLQSNELYEQGTALGEIIAAPGGNDVERLWVGDSKGLYFHRNKKRLDVYYRPPGAERNTRRDGTEQIERLLRNSWQTGRINTLLDQHGYRALKPDTLDIISINNEADSPYGVSMIRSLEFVSKALATMTNSVYLTWQRFGDPSYELTYKTKNKAITRDEGKLDERRDALAANFEKALKAKRNGKTYDFVNAIGADDELVLNVIGADNQVLEIEMPARFVLEQILAKMGIPPWMLGYVWGTAERLAEKQVDMALQGSKTRFENRLPGLRRIVETGLRLRGVSWNAGEWRLYQELPNLKDEESKAKAEFMYAQAEAVRAGAATTVTTGGEEPAKINIHANTKTAGPAHCNHKVEQYVEDEDNLMRLERSAERGLLSGWDALYDDVLTALNIDTGKSAKAPDPVFVFDEAAMYQALLDLEQAFIDTQGGEDAALTTSNFRAWLRGVSNGADELGADQVEEQARENMRQSLQATIREQVSDTTRAALSDDIIKTLADGAYDGLNPLDVARELRKRFDAHDVDWTRLARSEVAAAQGAGKMAQYAAHGLEQYDFIPAGDACPICNGKAADNPHVVGAGPLPVRDTHPNCRCTVSAVV